MLLYTIFKLYGCSTGKCFFHILVLDFGHWSVSDYVPFRHQMFGSNSNSACKIAKNNWLLISPSVPNLANMLLSVDVCVA